MPKQQSTARHAGRRIRERRVALGIKQTDLARNVGMSASYLNLIEHDRRKIGGKLLVDIASALKIEPVALAEGAKAEFIEALNVISAGQTIEIPEDQNSDALANRFPIWAKILIEQQRKLRSFEKTVESLSDRLSHDPDLSASLHDVMSIVTSIRSTASILDSPDTVEPEWQERFHRNLFEDARRLSDRARDLVEYLNRPDDRISDLGTPHEEMRTFFSAKQRMIDLAVDGDGSAYAIVMAMAQSDMSAAAHRLWMTQFERMRREAKVLPKFLLQDVFNKHEFRIDIISSQTGVPQSVVLRRLCDANIVNAGYLISDASGGVRHYRALDGFTVARFSVGCALWPLYRAFSKPYMLNVDTITQNGRELGNFETITICEAVSPEAINGSALMESTMLVRPVRESGWPVGVHCRICPLSDCVARREPSMLSDGL